MVTKISESDNKVMALAKCSTSLLSVLEPYLDNERIPLKEKDRDNIGTLKQFLDYAVRGCDATENLKLIFKYDRFFGEFFATPTSALNLTIEILHNHLPQNRIPWTLKEIKNRCLEYKIILEKFEKGESFKGNYVGIAKEVVSFFDAIGKKSDEIMANAYGPLF